MSLSVENETSQVTMVVSSIRTCVHPNLHFDSRERDNTVTLTLTMQVNGGAFGTMDMVLRRHTLIGLRLKLMNDSAAT